jgi:hypothetical protein
MRNFTLLLMFSFLPLWGVTWPITVSSNRRYFQDSAGVPFIMNFDVAHAIIGGVCPSTSASGCSGATTTWANYFSSRQGYGFNGTQIWATTLKFSSNGQSKDGQLPFTSGTGPSTYDLSTPNATYWAEISAFVSQAASAGMIVAIDPLPGQLYDCNSGGCEETGSAPTFANNGATKVTNFGAYIGNLLKGYSNVMYYIGDDCGTFSTNSSGPNSSYCNMSLEADLVSGILSADSTHLISFEGSWYYSYQNQYWSWAGASPQLSAITGISSVWSDLLYSYYESYGIAKAAYASSPTSPCFMGEAYYEGSTDDGLSPAATTFILREQAWWTFLSGCYGYQWGNASVNHNDGSYPGSLTSAGAAEANILPALMQNYKWWTLAPDSSNSILTSGFGTSAPSNIDLYTANYASGAFDGSTNGTGTIGFVYVPGGTNGTVSPVVNMAHFANPVVAQWFDPSNAKYTSISGSPFANSASHTFTTPGSNHDGNNDWVLVLQAAAIPTISSFTASPSSIPLGQSSTLSWNVSGAATLSISGVGVVSGTSVTVSPTVTTTYTLTATNNAGSATAAATVTVTSLGPAPPTDLTAVAH